MRFCKRSDVISGRIWYVCPRCGQKLFLYDIKEGKAQKLYLVCKKCKNEIEVNINI